MDPSLVFPAETAAFIVAAIVAVTWLQRSVIDDRQAMAPSFVVEFGALLLLGGPAAIVVAGMAAIAQALRAWRSTPWTRTLVNAAASILAMAAAAFAHTSLGGTVAHIDWPYQGLPLALAIVAYCAVKTAFGEIVAPFMARGRVSLTWRTHLANWPVHFIAAAIVVAAVEIIEHRSWAILPFAAIPVYFIARAYVHQLNRRHNEHRDRLVVQSLNQAACVVDGTGQVTLWNQALERLVKHAGEQAVGRRLLAVLPALDRTELPRALHDAIINRTPQMLGQITLPSGATAKIFQVTLVPVADGVMLLWDDVTQRARAEQALRRNEERLALATEAATDGLWEWNLRTQEFFFSARMWAMLGLRMPDGTCRAEEWFDRVHPEDLKLLKEAIDAHLAGKIERLEHEHRIKHADGSYRWFICRGLAASVAGRRSARIAGSLTDVTERVHAQERLRSAGYVDPLTGVGNRAIFVEGLGRRLDQLKKRQGEARFAVLYLDLDRFKVVNDSLGHLVGDQLLTQVTRRLETCLRDGDALARMGGDEFAILLNGLTDEQQASAIAFRIQKALSSPFQIGGREVFTSASIGIAFGRPQYTSHDEIMRDADIAMYHAKSRGKARHELFDADMHERARNRLGIENDLRHATVDNDFEVHYQPIVNLASRKCVGFESLIRWTREGKPVSPAMFIPIAEELGLIEAIGTWVMQTACATFADWQRRFPAAGLEFITVNVSSRQLLQQNFIAIVEQAVQAAGLKPSALRIEITETALMESPHVVAEVLRELRTLGVRIYLDDFGTGYSSLSHLHKLPVDALKIDRSFVISLQRAERPSIVESILALARTLNTSVVAEGIETNEQAVELARLGCTNAQGYLFSRPLAQTAVEEMLTANQALGPLGAEPGSSKAEPELAYASPMPLNWPDLSPGELLSNRE